MLFRIFNFMSLIATITSMYQVLVHKEEKTTLLHIIIIDARILLNRLKFELEFEQWELNECYKWHETLKAWTWSGSLANDAGNNIQFLNLL